MMFASLPGTIVTIFLIHIGIGIYAWFEKRWKPVLSRLTLFEDETEILHSIALEYIEIGVAVPGLCLVSPQSAIVTEAKRIETRMLVELIAVGCAGFIPSGFIALLFSLLQ
tara:strand:- start:19 stop:351 length:333 start_codon:yes stop_codon:yes gene_type:complete